MNKIRDILLDGLEDELTDANRIALASHCSCGAGPGKFCEVGVIHAGRGQYQCLNCPAWGDANWANAHARDTGYSHAIASPNHPSA